METLLNKLYDEIYSPKITPYELVSNAKLDHYQYVNMYKESEGLTVESSCLMGAGIYAKFVYKFDLNDKLLSLTSFYDGIEKVEYNRSIAIQEIKEQLQDLLAANLKSEAV
ncbi:hypothetical protein [Paenibacillus silviterrae]|uniref:hypothetical protein n=2 Tax=Paenibacillus silviterrae TaxID=3242194 RepID=UPI002543946A|nr:hypothetical protein [Paenibacillus chinjuensis]